MNRHFHLGCATRLEHHLLGFGGHDDVRFGHERDEFQSIVGIGTALRPLFTELCAAHHFERNGTIQPGVFIRAQ